MSGISNDKIYEAILSLKEDVGALKNGQTNGTAYVGAVNRKADDIRKDLDAHKSSQDAHGVAGSRRTWADVLAWSAVALAAVEIGLGIKLRHGG